MNFPVCVYEFMKNQAKVCSILFSYNENWSDNCVSNEACGAHLIYLRIERNVQKCLLRRHKLCQKLNNLIKKLAFNHSMSI